jgi:hypothetical protein
MRTCSTMSVYVASYRETGPSWNFPLGDVPPADAEVERPLARLEGVAVAEPLELLVFLRERVPDALEGNGVVAGQGESGASESAFDCHGSTA